MLEDELEQKIYLRKMRAHTTFDGTVYNAFCARVYFIILLIMSKMKLYVVLTKLIK